MDNGFHMLIIDDEVMLTDLLAKHFRCRNYLVWTANNKEEAMANINQQLDIILLDINMPDMDGLTFCKEIREHINCPIIFLTARIQENDIIDGFKNGGDDYITKPFSLEELSARVSAHLRREQRKSKPAKIFSTGDLIINFSEQAIYYKEKLLNFSRTEYDLISYLAGHAGYVLDKEKIYEAVWGYDAEGDSNVIKEHIRKIRMKLARETGREYIETVWGMGYRWKNK